MEGTIWVRGYYLGRRGEEGVVFHYTLRKFICVNGAHFSTGPGRTWARFSPLYSPDNGVTLHSFVLVDLVYFSSVAFDRAARVPQPPFPKPLYYVVENQRAKNDPRRNRRRSTAIFASLNESRFLFANESICFWCSFLMGRIDKCWIRAAKILRLLRLKGIGRMDLWNSCRI